MSSINDDFNDGGVPLLIDDAQDANVSEIISKNTNNNNTNNSNVIINSNNLHANTTNTNNNNTFNPSASRFSGSDEFANEQMYNSYEHQAMMYAQSQKRSNNNAPNVNPSAASNNAGAHNNNNQQHNHHHHHQHHHQFVPNNHPSVSPFETNLFVAGLPPGTDDEKLASYFTKYGKIVSARVLVDLVTHSLRNYGFVKFETRLAAEKAIGEMNEYRVTPHQILHVTWATHREDAPECDTLYVRNLPDNVTRQDLNNYFSQYGEVRELSLPRCAPFRGVCFVRYKTNDEAAKALDGTHNATPFGNRALQVRYKAPSKKIPNDGSGNAGPQLQQQQQQQQQQLPLVQQQQGYIIPAQQQIMTHQNGVFAMQAGVASPQQQQTQYVQVIGPNGQIQLVPHQAVVMSTRSAGPTSPNNSTSSHPLGGSNSRSTHVSPGSSMEGNPFHQHHQPPPQFQQQQILQTLPNGHQVLVMTSAPPPPPVVANNNNNMVAAAPFPAQGDLCFFNVTDDNELMRYLIGAFGQVAISRRTPEGALLVRLYNTQQHDFCAKTLNGKAMAPGHPALTVGLVGFQPQ